MNSTPSTKFCFCGVRAAALTVAIYKVIFISVCLVLSAVGADLYKEAPEHYSEDDARIHRVIGGALIALAIFCTGLLCLNVMLLWAVIKRKSGHIKWWIRLTVVFEVLICSTMFMTTWDTLRSFCLCLNFALNIFFLKAVCAYQRSLISDTKGSVLENEETEGDQTLPKRLLTENLHTSETPEPATSQEEKSADEVRPKAVSVS